MWSSPSTNTESEGRLCAIHPGVGVTGKVGVALAPAKPILVIKWIHILLVLLKFSLGLTVTNMCPWVFLDLTYYSRISVGDTFTVLGFSWPYLTTNIADCTTLLKLITGYLITGIVLVVTNNQTLR